MSSDPTSSPEADPMGRKSLSTEDDEHKITTPADTKVQVEVDQSASPAKDVEKAEGANSPPGDDAETNYQPKTFQFWAIILSIFLALFLVALDRTIIGTAIPQITVEFDSLGDIGWYGSAYMLTTSAMQLVFGRIYRFYSVKTFLACVIVFEIGSAICGAAPNSATFIAGRAIAGLGSAGLFTGCMVLMIPMVPLRKRPMFQGIFGMVFGVSSVIGPLVGGGFTDGVSWRWCFWLNLPVGAVTVLCLIFLLRVPSFQATKATPWEHFKRLDPLGTFFFVPSIVCLLLALQWGGSTYAWNSGRIIALLVLFVVLFVAFAMVQVFNTENATVPLRVISQRSILAGACFQFFLASAMLMTVYFTPLWFQVVQGVSAVRSGVYTLPFVLSLVVASILGGAVTQKVGYYVPNMIICPSLMAIGLGLMSTFQVDTNSAHWIGYQFLAGFGLGFGMQTGGLAAQAVLPKPDQPTGIAIMFFMQQLGGAVFTSVAQNILSNLLVSRLGNIPGFDASSIVDQGATDVISQVPEQYRSFFLDTYNFCVTRVFVAGASIVCFAVVAALFMEWKNIKKTGPPAAAPQKSKEEAKEEAKEEGKETV